jgi:MerR family transcriptional regulator, light-induced transcriptional regulator
VTSPGPHDFLVRLDAACGELDDLAFDGAWHDAVARLGIVVAVRDVLLPYLHLLGEQWETGTRSVAHEHFASGLSRDHLLKAIGADRAPDPDDGRPSVLVACPPGERHDLGPLAFATLLHDTGWRVEFLGADTPLVTLARACQLAKPDLVVVSGTRTTVLEARTSAWRRLAEDTAVVLGGAGATPELSATTGLPCLDPDVAVALEQVRSLVPSGSESVAG